MKKRHPFVYEYTSGVSLSGETPLGFYGFQVFGLSGFKVIKVVKVVEDSKVFNDSKDFKDSKVSNGFLNSLPSLLLINLTTQQPDNFISFIDLYLEVISKEIIGVAGGVGCEIIVINCGGVVRI